MEIVNISPIDGEVYKMDIDITMEQYQDWQNGTQIQFAMPNISPAEREFILTGITPKQWNEIFGEDNE